MARYGRPDIFNTDQGSQFTSPRFTGLLTAAGIRVSMDGRGRWMDNVFIERLWRSMKYECVYLHASPATVPATAWVSMPPIRAPPARPSWTNFRSLQTMTDRKHAAVRRTDKTFY
jgi:putative transposase